MQNGLLRCLILNSAKDLTRDCHFSDGDSSPCPSSLTTKSSGSNITNSEVRHAASRKKSHDNLLYCPNSGDLKHGEIVHFQSHWIKGEPIIVRNVLENSSGLISWDPMVMQRAMKGAGARRNLQEMKRVKAIDCFNWGEVEINIKHCFHEKTRSLKILKLKDWPPSTLFEDCLPRHGAENMDTL